MSLAGGKVTIGHVLPLGLRHDAQAGGAGELVGVRGLGVGVLRGLAVVGGLGRQGTSKRH